MRRTSTAFALSSMLGSLAFGSSTLAQDGSEVDLTGTWQGAQICEGLIGGEFSNFVVINNLLLVLQDGDTFRFVYIGDQEEIADDLVYEGVIQHIEGSDHFEALAGMCGGDYKAEECQTACNLDPRLECAPEAGQVGSSGIDRGAGFSEEDPWQGSIDPTASRSRECWLYGLR